MIIEGNIVNIDGITRGRIEIGSDGIITNVGKETGKADVILADELIFPGFIDLHVHARECADHSQDYKEDFFSAGAAAINGGVVAFMDMPNNPVPPVTAKSYAEKYQLTKKSAVEVVLYAGIGKNTKPFECSAPIYGRLGSPIHRHATMQPPYKVFMGKSVGDLFFENFDELDKSLEKYSSQNISFHCEDPSMLLANKNQLTHQSQRPPEAEISAVDFALQMIEKYQLTGKICHASTIESIKKIVTAKKRGIKVTVEVAPHHLYFDEEILRSVPIYRPSPDAHKWARYMQVNPPIRQSHENRLALITALKNGDIDYLATDHAPHTIAEKEKGMSGLTHLDTYGPFVTWLMVEHQFSPGNVMQVCSQNPGNFISQFSASKYGKIAKGYAGSLTVIDMKRPIIIDKSKLNTKADWSPFEGVKFPGSVVMTIIRGKVYKKHN